MDSQDPGVATSSLPAGLVVGLRRRHLPGLDAIRAAAVSLVILYHADLPLPGGTGVLLFFVLSGFLITWLLLKEVEKSGTISLRNFYARRALRLLPAFYVYVVFALALSWLRHRPVNYGQLWASLFYVTNYWQGLYGDPNTGLSHTWSLAVEEQFYLLWPVAFLFLRYKFVRMSRMLVGAIAAVWIYRVMLVLVLRVSQGYIYEAFDTRADSLLLGCLLAVLLSRSGWGRFFRIICSGHWKILITLVGFALSYRLESLYGHEYRDTLGFALNGVLTFVLIAQVICHGTSKMKWLEFRPISYLGKISYSLYLWQQIIVPVTGKALAGANPAIRILCQFVAVIIVASASWWIVERPLLKMKSRFGSLA